MIAKLKIEKKFFQEKSLEEIEKAINFQVEVLKQDILTYIKIKWLKLPEYQKFYYDKGYLKSK